MFIAKFIMASSLKKIRSITFIVWVPGRVEKNVKKVKKIFFLFKANINVTHIFTSFFNVLFKNIFLAL